MLNEMTIYKAVRELAERLRAEQKANPPTHDQVGAARAAMKAADTAAAVAADALLAAASERARAEASAGGGDQWIIDLVLLTRDDQTVPSEARCNTLRLALQEGVDWATWYVLVWARRVSQVQTVLLPVGRYAHLSRGKSWCRKGNGNAAEWGEKTADGRHFRVGPGRWIVGSNDGFDRKEQTTWEVMHVTVGTSVWTVSS